MNNFVIESWAAFAVVVVLAGWLRFRTKPEAILFPRRARYRFAVGSYLPTVAGLHGSGLFFVERSSWPPLW